MKLEKLNFRVWSYAYGGLILLVSSIPADYLPREEMFSIDKLFHVIEYFGFTLLVGFAHIYSVKRRYRMKWIPYTLRIGMLFPIFDELYQSLIPGRISSWLDVIADLSGVTLAIVILAFIYDKYIYKDDLK
ncbi:MAG: VanZ family protein [Candidatus Marinimicrobia bacterium]|nr:VanZ family protein [Candidatus Neomarinimicrobiota bacterium]